MNPVKGCVFVERNIKLVARVSNDYVDNTADQVRLTASPSARGIFYYKGRRLGSLSETGYHLASAQCEQMSPLLTHGRHGWISLSSSNMFSYYCNPLFIYAAGRPLTRGEILIYIGASSHGNQSKLLYNSTSQKCRQTKRLSKQNVIFDVSIRSAILLICVK